MGYRGSFPGGKVAVGSEHWKRVLKEIWT